MLALLAYLQIQKESLLLDAALRERFPSLDMITALQEEQEAGSSSNRLLSQLDLNTERIRRDMSARWHQARQVPPTHHPSTTILPLASRQAFF